MEEMIMTNTNKEKPTENIIPKKDHEEECDDDEDCEDNDEDCDDEEEDEEYDDDEDCEEDCDEEDCDEEDEEYEEYDDDAFFRTIYFIIVQNKPDYYTDFPNKSIWDKNMKSYVHTYSQNNTVSSYNELINVPKYLIDAPFETPNVTDDPASYNEDTYDIIAENIDTNSDTVSEPSTGSEVIIENKSDDTNYYIIRIHEISVHINNKDMEQIRRDRQAYEDFEAGDELGDNIRDGVSCIASTCSKIVLVTYVLAFFVGIMPLVLSEKNNINNQHQQWCSDHMYCSKYQ